MRTERRPPFYLPVLLLLLALFTCCEDKPDFIGRELLPSGDDFSVNFDSVELVYGYTRYADSIRTGYNLISLLGNTNDPFFGSSSAEIVTTISSSYTSKGFGSNAAEDSVILSIRWLEDLSVEDFSPITVHVYEFSEFIEYDSSYYSNWDITGKYREPELGSATIFPGDTMARIYITDREFIDKFLTAEDTLLSDPINLQAYMYGLYYTTDKTYDEGHIFQINFDDTDNILRFYYHNDTAAELTQYYSLDNSTNGKFNLFEHDPAGYPLEGYLQNGSQNDSLLFVQSMAGVTSQIHFPELAHWKDSMPIAINEARLIFPVADSSVTLQKRKYLPERLSLYLLQEDGSYARMYDDILEADISWGQYNADLHSYVFDIKVHIQSVVEGKLDNLRLAVVPRSTGEVNVRTGLNGWNREDPGKRLRLEIIYTKL